MAQRIESGFDWTPMYPFDDWFDGATWVLTRYEDFEKDGRAMQKHLHTEASRRGMSVRTKRLDDERIAVQRTA